MLSIGTKFLCVAIWNFAINQIAAICTSNYDNPIFCMPPSINAARGKSVVATSTCGNPEAEEYCLIQTRYGQPHSCHVCDDEDKEKSHGTEFLTDLSSNTWWQSKSLLDNEMQRSTEVNLTLDFGKAIDVQYIQLQFQSPRPESFAVYKKRCNECQWQPFQYYSSACQSTYSVPDQEYLSTGDEDKVLCTSEYSDITPLTGGSVTFSPLARGRSNVYRFDESVKLQDWVKTTAIRISLTRLNTFGDEVFKEPEVLRSYYYAISDLTVFGRCSCNGHASSCYVNNDNATWCSCEHNTVGQDCERCGDFCHDLPWQRGTPENPGACQACDCNGNSYTCYFDEKLYEATGHGGRCTNCSNNTEGPHCEICLSNHYRNARNQCQPCDCHEFGSVSPQCNINGRCECNPGFKGRKCHLCKNGNKMSRDGLCTVSASRAQSRNRLYFLAIQEIVWDYAPTDLNLITNNKLVDETETRVFTELYVGKRYKKAVFRRYTDSSFQTEIPHDPNLGYLGPILRAEVGDNLTIHLFNNASREYSLHPHGLFYTKSNEGARYEDGSINKADDAVPSGGTNVYHWEVRPEYGPTVDDPNCLTWAYHSHTNTPKDVNSGLIGPLIVCRPGIYREDDSRTDVDHEFVAMFFVTVERDSWYFWQNLQAIPGWEKLPIESEEFDESNKMHGINGYIFGNTPGYEVCQGDTISWHLMGMGTNDDLHAVHFQGQIMMNQHHRKDSMILIPATFSTVTMRANNPGQWLVACKLYSHFTEGMASWMTVDPTCRKPGVPLPSESLDGETRTYYVAAEEILWNYAPSGMNKLTNESLKTPGSDSEVFFADEPTRIGGVYKKAVFREYEDDSFNVTKSRPADLGLLGPIIAGEIGDTIRIVFKNTAQHRAFNMEPHGVYFQQQYPTPPNSKRIYTWTLPDDVAPSENDPNCLTYIYTSSVSYIADSNAGLVGPLLVCKRGTLASELEKNHKYILMTVFDENESWYFDENVKAFASELSDDDIDADFEESNLMHNMNGLMYGNLELNLCADEETTLHVMGVGSSVDIHGIDLEGINVKTEGANTGVVQVFAHTFNTVTIQPSYVGSGRMFCRTIDHTITGMSGIYNSDMCSSNSNEAETANEEIEFGDNPYFIAAVEEIWDYDRRRINIHGESTDIEGVNGYLYSHHEPGRLIGSRYKKAMFFEYTDETFTTRKPKPAHLGILGPIIQGEVGKPISVVFFNNASRPYNMFPWGAVDSSANSKDPKPVQPGETKRYVWQIPESASPGENQTACQSFVYVSNVDAAIDPVDGLMGPLLVCKRGTFSGPTVPFYEPTNVDAEFFLQFLNFDENLSHYLDENVRLFLQTDPKTFEITDEFEESNKMKAINGYLWHVEDLIMRKDDLVRWHLIGWGNEEDYHSVHFHAHTYIHVADGSYRGDVFDVFPGFLGTVEMRVIEPGDWLLHCHVFDHLHSGMQTVYSVTERDGSRMDEGIDSTQTIRNICGVEVKDGNNYYNCNRMNVSSIFDFTRRRKILPARFDNGTNIRAGVKSVQYLNLADNGLTTLQARRILRSFTNLRQINLDRNRLRSLPSAFLLSNPQLRSFSAKKNLYLRLVSRRFLFQSLPDNRAQPREMELMDLSENNAITPSCLNTRFTSTEPFLACFKL